jgi:hypothetical protein
MSISDAGVVTVGQSITTGTINAPTMFRNVIQNGTIAIDQRNAGASQTFTAAAALAYSVDRWYGYCTGANVTGRRVAGTLSPYMYQFTGAASVTKIGFAQRIEASNCWHLAGGSAKLAVDLSNSLLTTVTWTAWYANTADTFGTLASPTRTQIATGTLTVTSTNTRYYADITVPAAATTGIEIEFSVGAQTSGTWKIGRVQLEPGTVATPFELRPYGTELALCERYCQLVGPSGYTYGSTLGTSESATAVYFEIPHRQVMRATPTSVTLSTGTPKFTGAGAATITLPSPVYDGLTAYASRAGSTSASGLTSKTLYSLSDCFLLVSAEL